MSEEYPTTRPGAARFSFKSANREANSKMTKNRFGNISVQGEDDIKNVLREDQMNFGYSDDPDSEGGICATAKPEYMVGKIYDNLVNALGKDKVNSRLSALQSEEKARLDKRKKDNENKEQRRSGVNIPSYQQEARTTSKPQDFWDEDYEEESEDDYFSTKNTKSSFWLRCSGCQSALPTRAKFCPECGEKTDSGCTTCGKELIGGENFCPGCGSKQ